MQWTLTMRDSTFWMMASLIKLQPRWARPNRRSTTLRTWRAAGAARLPLSCWMFCSTGAIAQERDRNQVSMAHKPCSLAFESSHMKPSAMQAALAAILLSALLTSAHAQPASDEATLTAVIAGLDTKVFDAYNDCALEVFGSYFVPDVEFYHDQGGATFDRATVIANTKKYICGKVRRILVASSMHIYPIKDFGAIEEGEHQFCEITTGKCEGAAKFLIIWKSQGKTWQITRVMSFGHRALTPAEQVDANARFKSYR